ncbi:unnamed protein product [Trifolium pratense]|uniref:Uncharacterized protein n=1 Tax=Trifolium pratense TaxID=57577 RepID=A0ACB0M2G6_TRIPR|nr:unnamed protein product [Trifolium pratense]
MIPCTSCNGWQQFVKDHSLKENDFLVFKYKGESHFEVLIFDGESLCEKTASYFVGKCGHAQTEQGGSKAKDTNTCAEEAINTASNGKTCNAGVEFASPEKLTADALTKTTTIQFPFQPTGKRAEKPVNEVTPVQTKKRGRPPKAGNSYERAHDLVACNKEHSGWMDFVRGNGIKIGNVCIFELIRENELRVCIAEVGKDGLDFQDEKLDFSVPSARQDALPKTFSNNVKKKLPENVTLRGPSRVVWKVGLTTRGDTLYFTNGWQQFVKDHSLKENDFLVFKYKGESHFEVLIFDGESLCEKTASYFVGKCRPAQTEQGGSKAKDTASNGGVETPLVVPIGTNNGKTCNAGVESASPEKLTVDALTKTTTIQFPFQPTGKRAEKPVNEVTPVQTKK